MSEYLQQKTQQRHVSHEFAAGRNDQTDQDKVRDDDSSKKDRDGDRSHDRRDEGSSSGQGQQSGDISHRSWEDPEKGWSR